MAWWNDILGMLKEELTAAGKPPAHTEPDAFRHAQNLLRRTSRELTVARTRAEALRRRLARTQASLDALTHDQPDPRYRERLAALARSIAEESALAGGFATYIAQVDALHDRIERQLREFERDVAMARTAHAAREATSAARKAGVRKAAAGEAPERFRRARPEAVLQRLKDLPAGARKKPAAKKKESRSED